MPNSKKQSLALLGFFLALTQSPIWADVGKVEKSLDLSKWDTPVADSLKKNVEFWIQVNSQYTNEQGLIHDSDDVSHIYSVLNLKKSKNRGSDSIRREKAKWRQVLLSVHRKQATPEKFSADEKRIFEMFKDTDEPNKFLNAAHRKRLRFQRGQRESFLSGLGQSGKYLHRMEATFTQAGLPVELTRLPFVESSFNLKARSKVGASGIFQFMKSTARLFLRVDDRVDERNDPLRASEAAAQLLKLNFQSLGNWPLAVTAYNHGRKALMRAVRRVGSDRLEDLIGGYTGRSFGFASRNFYPELVALVELEKNPSKYFKPSEIERAPELLFYEVKLSRDTELPQLMETFGVSIQEMREFNPGLSEDIFLKKIPLPAGYRLRMKRIAAESEEALTRRFFEKFNSLVKSPQGDGAPSIKM